MANIHPAALVDPGADLDATVTVGPWTRIGPNVRVAAGTSIGSHCVIEGHTSIGRENRIFQFSSIGAAPQDKKYAGEPTRLEIGDRNVIREFCTFNTGTAQDAGVTRLGDDNWMMAYVHLAHDVQVGNKTIFANNAQVAGHVVVGDWAILSAFTAAHQFVRVGAHAITGMGSILLQDVPPFVTAAGNPAQPHGINSEGLKRRNFSAAHIASIRRAYKSLYKSGLTLEEAKRALAEAAGNDAEARESIHMLLAFVSAATRGIVR
jgi:UDP-N-acetylglucosamine acyltransferase